MRKPRILVLASGSKTGGGSGFQELVEFSRTEPPVLCADIVAVVSNHDQGGVHERAMKLNIPFIHWPQGFTAQGYQSLVKSYEADYVMCSGWLKYVRGLNPGRVVNIHPGPTKGFGGPGFFGHHVHEAVMAAFKRGEIKQSAVTIHFVTEEGANKEGYDKGPEIFQLPVLIRRDDTPETLAARVNEKERAWQAYVLNLVVWEQIHLERNCAGWQVVYENHLNLVVPH